MKAGLQTVTANSFEPELCWLFYKLFRPGVLFFIDISTTANEMKAGLQTVTANSFEPELCRLFYSRSTRQIHSKHSF